MDEDLVPLEVLKEARHDLQDYGDGPAIERLAETLCTLLAGILDRAIEEGEQE